MSSIDIEEYSNSYNEKFRTGSGRRRRREKAVLHDCFITKSLCDPEKALSRKNRERLLNDHSDGFCVNVPYSLNKHNRWKKITDASLLGNQTEELPETVVIDRIDIPGDSFSKQGTVRSVKIIEGIEGMKVLSTNGRRKPLTYFNKQIRFLRQMDKEEVEPARLHFNITSLPDFTAQKSQKKSKKTRRRFNVLEDMKDQSYGQQIPNTSIEKKVLSEDCGGTNIDNLRLKTLGDYLVLPRRFSQRPTSQTFEEVPLEKDKSVTLPALIEISEATKTAHIFEVFETKTTSIPDPPFDLEQILATIPKGLFVKRFSPKRIRVSSSSYHTPNFVIFFEEDKNRGILRVRISTDSQYPSETSKIELRNIVKNSPNRRFASLCEDLVEFIRETVKKEAEVLKKDSRMTVYRENFPSELYSRFIAPFAVRRSEEEQLEYLNEYYVHNSFEGSSTENTSEKQNLEICCACHIPYNTDLFTVLNGHMCRECLASAVTRQLRLRNFPLEIPVIAPPDSSPLDLLYAVLPIPVMSLLIKKSFAFFNCLDYPDLKFLTCLHCSASLVLFERCEFNSCSCPCCGFSFCFLCNSEPHWPMDCEQFQRWSDRWDAQCYFEENSYGEDFSVKFCIQCETTYRKTEIPYERCFDCRWHWDKEKGEYYHWHGYEKALKPETLRLIAAMGVKIEYCSECGKRTGPWTIELRRVVDKEFATICTEARKERVKKPGNEDFGKFVMEILQSRKEQSKVNDLRKTVLYLVENCTAWLYLTKPAECYHLKLLVAKLFRQLLTFQRSLHPTKEIFMKHLEKLEEAAQQLIATFRCLTEPV